MDCLCHHGTPGVCKEKKRRLNVELRFRRTAGRKKYVSARGNRDENFASSAAWQLPKIVKLMIR